MPNSWTIRRATYDDAPNMYATFSESIQGLTSGDYTAKQQKAWIGGASADYFRTLIALEQHDIWVAEASSGHLAGFAALHHNDISYLYVLPVCTRRGLGTQLLSIVEAAALLQGESELFLRSSLTARPFYERNGFAVLSRTLIRRQGVSIPTYTMLKTLRPER